MIQEDLNGWKTWAGLQQGVSTFGGVGTSDGGGLSLGVDGTDTGGSGIGSNRADLGGNGHFGVDEVGIAGEEDGWGLRLWS